MQKRQNESSCLPGTGLGCGYHVMIGESQGDRFFLNRCWLSIARFSDGADEPVIELKISKTNWDDLLEFM